MKNIYKWFSELFFMTEKNDTFVGLAHLRAHNNEELKPKAPIKTKRNKDIKISDLMRGANIQP